MSTRIYCDQCGTETSKRKALRFSLSGYSANRTSMGQLNDIEIDICPDCAQRFNDQTIGTIQSDETGDTLYSAHPSLTQDMYRGTITLALLRWIGHLEQFSQITNQQDKDDA